MNGFYLNGAIGLLAGLAVLRRNPYKAVRYPPKPRSVLLRTDVCVSQMHWSDKFLVGAGVASTLGLSGGAGWWAFTWLSHRNPQWNGKLQWDAKSLWGNNDAMSGAIGGFAAGIYGCVRDWGVTYVD
jgi:hypothetical protein